MSLRSFCGGKLHGDNLVRLVYVDEAGIGNPQQEPLVVVAGIIVHGDHQLNDLLKSLEKLRKRRLPAERRDDFVLHAKELFNGGGTLFGRNNPEWPLEKRLQIADDLAAIPKALRLRIAYGSMKRDTFAKHANISDHEKMLGALAGSFFICAARIDSWMRRHAKNENCLIIAEDNPSARSLIVKVHNENQNQLFLDSIEGGAKKFFPFRHLREDPAFQPKKPAHPLELADFCAYVLKRSLMDQQDERYLRFLNPMRDCFATF